MKVLKLTIVLFWVGLICSCSQSIKNDSNVFPAFPKKAAERDFKRTVNSETKKVPRKGLMNAYNQLVEQGKINPNNSSFFKTANDEIGWQKVNDYFPNMAITSLAFDPNNTNVFYFATGEGWFNADAVRGAGVWKSEDAGATWNQLSSTANDDVFYWCQKIAVHPETSDVYLATQDNGLYRSQDGGNTWERVLGTGIGAIRNSFVDIEFTADNEIFASTGVFETGRIYYSQTGNLNEWELRSGPQGYGINPFTNHRIELATAPSNANVLYAIPVENDEYMIDGIYRSEDKGMNWIEVNNPDGDYDMARNQAWYDLSLAVDPNDENIVVAGGINLWRTIDGGQNWQQLSHGRQDSLAYQYVHVDQHSVHFVNSDTVYFTNDGGIYVSHDFSSAMPTILPRNNGYNVTQYYAAAIFQEAGDFRIFGGTQDNGTYINTANDISNFERLTWQDGGFCDQHPTEENILFTSSQLNAFFRVNIDNNTIDTLENPFIEDENVLFINPMAINPYNPDNLFIGTDIGVWRLPNALTSTKDDWELASNLGIGSISAFGFSAQNPNTVFVGRERFSNSNQPIRLYVLENANTSNLLDDLVNIDINQDLPTTGTITTSSIYVNPKDDNHVFVTYSNYGQESIFESKNALSGNARFTNIEGDLPDLPVYWFQLHPNDSLKAYIATEMGVFYTEQIDSSNTVWMPCTNGLPFVRTDMLRIRNSDNTILAATHGRGLWTAQLDNSAQEMNIDWQERGPANIGGRTRAFMIDPNVSSNRKIWAAGVAGGLWFVNDIEELEDFTDTIEFEDEVIESANVFPNPLSLNSALSFSLKENSDVTIQVFDMNGKIILNFGAQQFLAGNNTVALENLANLSSGKYILSLNIKGKTTTIKIIK